MRKTSLITLFVVILLLGGFALAFSLSPSDSAIDQLILPSKNPPPLGVQPSPTPTPPPTSGQTPNPTPTPPPVKPTPSPTGKVVLAVPFTPQAPTANWDELHGEACEEASAIMVMAYFNGRKDKTLPPAYVEEELEKLTEWEKDTFGYYLDIDSFETARLIRENYGLKTELISNYTAQDIEKAISDGKVVIVAAAGQLLGNPNFRSPGPPYHMLPIIGYDGKNFITNDPGTRKGAGYTYSYETILNAAGEWSHTDEKVHTNKKIAIIVSK